MNGAKMRKTVTFYGLQSIHKVYEFYKLRIQSNILRIYCNFNKRLASLL